MVGTKVLYSLNLTFILHEFFSLYEVILLKTYKTEKMLYIFHIHIYIYIYHIHNDNDVEGMNAQQIHDAGGL